MICKRILPIALSICLFLFVQVVNSESDDECKCDFDDPGYTAECDCALVCAVAMKDGKECNIVCDGSPKEAEAGETALFGDPTSYIREMGHIRAWLSESGPQLVHQSSFLLKALPKLLRSGYIGAPFIIEEDKQKIDRTVHSVFSEFGNEIRKSVANRSGLPFKSELEEGILVEASYRLIRLSMPKYRLKLIFAR